MKNATYYVLVISDCFIEYWDRITIKEIILFSIVYKTENFYIEVFISLY